jgi:hypothetical protein
VIDHFGVPAYIHPHCIVNTTSIVHYMATASESESGTTIIFRTTADENITVIVRRSTIATGSSVARMPINGRLVIAACSQKYWRSEYPLTGVHRALRTRCRKVAFVDRALLRKTQIATPTFINIGGHFSILEVRQLRITDPTLAGSLLSLWSLENYTSVPGQIVAHARSATTRQMREHR